MGTETQTDIFEGQDPLLWYMHVHDLVRNKLGQEYNGIRVTKLILNHSNHNLAEEKAVTEAFVETIEVFETKTDSKVNTQDFVDFIQKEAHTQLVENKTE